MPPHASSAARILDAIRKPEAAANLEAAVVCKCGAKAVPWSERG